MSRGMSAAAAVARLDDAAKPVTWEQLRALMDGADEADLDEDSQTFSILNKRGAKEEFGYEIEHRTGPVRVWREGDDPLTPVRTGDAAIAAAILRDFGPLGAP